MNQTRWNLLEDPLFSIVTPSGERKRASLPAILACLGSGQAFEFTALQPHQAHAWHAFLVQLAAIALHRAGQTVLPEEVKAWKGLLLGLTDGGVEPWCLVVEDLSKPAFLQPPVPEGTLAALEKSTDYPDGIDVLITAKNHDLKARRILHATPEHWIYALLSLQTMQGFLGAGNYGVSRMNGGFASRPCFSISSGIDWSRRIARDVSLLLGERERMTESFGYPGHGGIALLWLPPWDGTDSLGLRECDPFYLEICRRVRLMEQDGQIVAKGAPTKAPRIQAKDAKGNTGDIWTPIKIQEGTSLTVGGEGFSYKLLQELVVGTEYRPGASGIVQESDGSAPTVVASVLCRGQGKTEGFHERLLPVPGKARRMLGSKDGRSKLGIFAKNQVEAVASFRLKVLKPALCCLLQGAPDKLDFKDKRPDPWLHRLDEMVDRVFFDFLWATAEPGRPIEEAQADWERYVLGLGRRLLDDAIGSMPIPVVRRYRAIAAAERAFHGSARKVLPHAFPKTGELHEPSTNHA